MKHLPTLYKKDSKGKIREITIYIEGNTFWAVHGIKGGNLIKDNPTVCEAKNIGRANETTPEQQAEAEAQSRWQKKADTGYFKRIEDVDNIDYFVPMTAHDYKKYIDKHEDQNTIYVQPKLDGMRCIIRWENNELIAKSRKGKVICTVDHILEVLKPVLPKEVVLDGELYNHEFKNDFNKIISLARKTKPKPEDLEECAKSLQYHVYDCFNTSFPKANYEPRLSYIKRIGETVTNGTLVIVDTSVIIQNNHELKKRNIDDIYGQYIEQGYEGGIIRTNTKYEHKRTKALLKRKDFIDDEFKIIDVEEGKGKKSGMAATLTMLTKDGIEFKGSIKGTDEFRVEMLTRKPEIIGKEASVRFFEYTPDNVPRFPVVHSVRDYE